MRGASVIKIDRHTALSGSVPVHQLVSLVLLLAVKDRATEVQFEPSAAEGEWKLRYQVGHAWYEMVPVPLHVPISQEIRKLAGLDLSRSLWAYLRRQGTSRSAAQEGRIRLLLAGHAVDLGVTVAPSRDGGSGKAEAVTLRLPENHLSSEAARRVLTEYLATVPASEGSHREGGPGE